MMIYKNIVVFGILATFGSVGSNSSFHKDYKLLVGYTD